MNPASTPLTLTTVLTSWRFDAPSTLAILLAGGAYAVGLSGLRRRGAPIPPGPAWCFAVGCGLWALATMSVVGVYSNVLFWVRALQVLTLLLVVPFFLALGKPLTVLRGALDSRGRARFDHLLTSRFARLLAHPVSTSVAMLGTPWLLYLTPWYPAALNSPTVAALTDTALVLIGFGYFYARLQTDPVPRRYSQLISVIISAAETIGDGLLGIVLWLGPLIAADHYMSLNRAWGPSLRLDQTIGAGILWILGDVLGVPFLIILMRALSVDERARSVEVDAALDDAEHTMTGPASALWWENDPQMQDRFRRTS